MTWEFMIFIVGVLVGMCAAYAVYVYAVCARQDEESDRIRESVEIEKRRLKKEGRSCPVLRW